MTIPRNFILMKHKANQHKLGQHYSKESDLVNQYNTILKEKQNLTIVDPFCGEGHLIFHYLNLFDFDKQLEIIKNKKIIATDIYEYNVIYVKNKIKNIYNIEDSLLDEIVFVNDSFLSHDVFPIDTYILTNPPYLAKNIVKKKYPEDFDRYFLNTFSYCNDYFEISLELYSKYDGVWIVPSNIFSSELMRRARNSVFKRLDNIIIYKIKTFDSTGISVSTFNIDNSVNVKSKNVRFVSSKKTENLVFDIDSNGNIVKEWQNIINTQNTIGLKQGYIRSNIESGNSPIILLNEKYKPERLFVSNSEKQKLLNNILILRTTDTGGEDGKIGLYTINELWGDSNAVGLITKISSRVYVQLFFNNLSIEEQLLLKNSFNEKLNQLRKKYDSIFLTNYKNVSNDTQRKRISFKSSFSLINYILAEKKE